MSETNIRKKIEAAEFALKEAGPGSVPALNAVIDVLKEIAKELESKEKSSCVGPSPRPSEVAFGPESRGRKFRVD